MELEALQAILPEIKATGTSVVALSPMLEKYAPQLVNKLNLEFPLLCDPDNRYAKQLGIVHSLPQGLIEVYRGFNIDLERFNGNQDWQLPLPGRIIVGSDGLVKNVELSTDHTQRPEPSETLELLKSL